ncbi:MAG: hypothetical protein L0241_29960, partial [Planctomycetia bacterium]|nr:hypothetical protein [Planctomycetia bacterium]
GRAVVLGSVDSAYPLPALRYVAPEVIRGQSAGLAADIYSAGLVAYLLAERKHLIEGPTAAQIRERILKGPSTAGLPPSALNLQPDRRPANPEALRSELAAWFAQRAAGPTLSPPPPPPPVVPVAPPPAPPPPPARAVEPPPRGSLRAIRDLKGQQDLLALNNGQPWQLPRTGQPQEWPIIFTNGGPGDLCLRVRCAGDGLRLAPQDHLRVPPGASRYVVLMLDAQGGDFGRVDVEVEGGNDSDRVRIRLYRSH